MVRRAWAAKCESGGSPRPSSIRSVNEGSEGPSPVSKSSLRVDSGPASGAVLALGPEPLVLGREDVPDSVASAFAADDQLSRQHARIWDDGGRLTIEDLGSSNGTFVNGTRITAPTPLQPGD